MIRIKDLSKYYRIGDEEVHALDHASLHVSPGEFVGIIGPSGSGKSTLMNIIGCLDVADSGEYLLDGIPIENYSENELAHIRNRKIGFVFQSFNLIPKLTAEENVELPLIYQGIKKDERTERVAAALERVKLGKRANHFPTELSARRDSAGDSHPAIFDPRRRADRKPRFKNHRRDHGYLSRAAQSGQYDRPHHA